MHLVKQAGKQAQVSTDMHVILGRDSIIWSSDCGRYGIFP